MGGIERAGRRVRLAHLEVDLPDSIGGQRLDHLFHERPPQAVTPTRGGDGEVQDLAFVRGLERDDVAQDRTRVARFGDKKVRVGRDAVAKILCGPRVGEDVLLDRADRRDVVESSGTNLVEVGRSAPPISPELRRAGRTPAPSQRL